MGNKHSFSSSPNSENSFCPHCRAPSRSITKPVLLIASEADYFQCNSCGNKIDKDKYPVDFKRLEKRKEEEEKRRKRGHIWKYNHERQKWAWHEWVDEEMESGEQKTTKKQQRSQDNDINPSVNSVMPQEPDWLIGENTNNITLISESIPIDTLLYVKYKGGANPESKHQQHPRLIRLMESKLRESGKPENPEENDQSPIQNDEVNEFEFQGKVKQSIPLSQVSRYGNTPIGHYLFMEITQIIDPGKDGNEGPAWKGSQYMNIIPSRDIISLYPFSSTYRMGEMKLAEAVFPVNVENLPIAKTEPLQNEHGGGKRKTKRKRKGKSKRKRKMKRKRKRKRKRKTKRRTRKKHKRTKKRKHSNTKRKSKKK